MSLTTNQVQHPNYKKTHIPGIQLPGAFDAETFKEVLKYKPRLNEVFIATFPKCGTTYLQQIVYLIFSKGVAPDNQEQYFKCCPFLELHGVNGAFEMPRPNAIKTHLRFDLTPFSNDAKYIYMLRNPKDCVVSLYYHTTQLPFYQYQNAQLKDFFKLFIEGNTEFGSYFDHLKSWYAHKDDPNVLFLHYEETVDNPEPVVIKIGQFLGQEYGELLQNDSKLLQDIIKYSSFDFMKKQTNDFYEQNRKFKITRVRRGKIGGWRDELTQEQSQIIDQYIEKELGELCPDIISLWKKFNCI